MRWTRLLLLVPLAAAAVLAPLPAHADDEVRTYTGTWKKNGAPEVVKVTCAGDVCQIDITPLITISHFRPGPVRVENGSAHLELTPSACNEQPYQGPESVDVTLTETELTLHYVQRALSYPCDGGTDYFYPQDDTFTGTRAADEIATGEADSVDEGAAKASSSPGGSRASDSSRAISQLSTGDADAPSVLSALPVPADLNARNALVGVLLAVVLVILVAFPTALLNSASETGADRFSTWWRGRRGKRDVADASAGRWWAAGAGVFAAGVISSFVDPEFGFNTGSVRTVLSVLASFAIDVIIGWSVTVWAVRRTAPTVAASYTFKPFSLVIVAAAVAFTRITDFEPGIVFGLVAGVTFAGLLEASGEARASLVSLGYGAGVGLVAWLLYGLIDHPSGVVGTFISETLAATAIAGLAALPIALFPVPGMPGKTVFAWSVKVWAVCYALGLAAFFVVLMPTPYAWDEVGWSLRAWVLVYLAYLMSAIFIWLAVTRFARSRDDKTTPTGVSA